MEEVKVFFVQAHLLQLGFSYSRCNVPEEVRHRERLIEKRFFPADSKQVHRWSGTPDLFPVDTHIRCSWFIHKDS